MPKAKCYRRSQPGLGEEAVLVAFVGARAEGDGLERSRGGAAGLVLGRRCARRIASDHAGLAARGTGAGVGPGGLSKGGGVLGVSGLLGAAAGTTPPVGWLEEPDPGVGVDAARQDHVVERRHDHLEGDDPGSGDLARDGLEPAVGLPREDAAQSEGHVPVGDPDRPVEHEHLRGPRHAPPRAVTPNLPSRTPELDLGQDPVPSQPSARDPVLAQGSDEGIG